MFGNSTGVMLLSVILRHNRVAEESLANVSVIVEAVLNVWSLLLGKDEPVLIFSMRQRIY